jgi:hypothetical protein
MSLWRVKLFDNRSDGNPSRIGYLFADTQEAACEIASAEKAKNSRIDVTSTIMRPAEMATATGKIFWDD